MSFFWPHAFWLLLLPLGFAIAELVRRVRATTTRHPKILRAEASPSGLSFATNASASTMPKVRWRLWLGLALAVAAFARPQWGEVEEPVFEQSREILIGIDLSRSMLAPDVSPSRLERAKLLITALLERLAGERVGLAVFAGTAFLQSPLSADYEILREFLPALGPDFLPEGGTDYAALLDTALDAFSDDSDADRYLIILSDGESQTEDWESRVDSLRERGIRVIGLGIGTGPGAMLPDGVGGFVKDERGAVVLSRLNPVTLEELARRTEGAYRDASSWVDLASLLKQTVEAGQQGDFSEQRRARKIERFQWLLGPAFFVLLWSLWREFPVQPRQRAMTINSPKMASTTRANSTVAAFAFLLFISAMSDRLSAVDLVPPPQTAPANTAPADPAEGVEVDPLAAFEAPLATLIGQLSTQPEIAAAEYAALATQTLTYGQSVLESGQKPGVGVIYDAIDGVDAGEALDRNAADWPATREALLKLLAESQEPPPEDQEQEDEDKSDEEKEDQDKGDEGDKGDKGENGDKGDQGEDGENGEKQEGENGENESDGNGEKQESDSSDQQDQSGENQDQSEQEQQENKPGESAFGDLDEPKEEQPQPQPQPAPQPQDPGTQSIGGQPTQTQEAQQNPELAVPLQKLDQLKQQDSPAQLFQLMQDPKSQPPPKGRDW
jgi:Ca-activated chloride channel family protein